MYEKIYKTYNLCTINSKISGSYPQKCLLAYFEAMHSILSVANLFATDIYYVIMS